MKSYQSGQLLFELVAALGLVALILVTVVSLASVSVGNTSFSKNNALATKHTQDAIEWLRKVRDTSWAPFVARSSPTGSTYCITSFTVPNPWSGGTCGVSQVITGTIFQREVKLTSLNLKTPTPPNTSDVNPDAVSAEVTTKWTDAKGIHEAKSSTVFTIWQ